MTTCIIAEKPSVARDIARIVGATTKQDGYLAGNGYLVTWAMGHLITLAMPDAYGYANYKAEELPICPNPFQLIVRQVRKDKEYHEDPAALKQLKAIGSCFNQADRIIVATDAGREGELIFRWIYRHLNSHKPFDRLWISSLTDKAIREGLANIKPGSHYDHLYYAAQARAEADWLMGINASRALSIAYRGGYSLGRVQTPTLTMVCHRYMEHRDFTSVPYWKLTAMIEDEGLSIKAVSLQNFDNEAAAQTALTSLRSIGSLTVTEVTRKVTHTAPPLLYDLTALQKEANVRHGFSADKTLTLAQSLYEKKFTTYPRTGSRYISEDVFEEVPDLLRKIGKPLPQELNRHSVDDSKVTDHHAIIPTGETASALSVDEATLYQMIVTRFVEAFSAHSEEERMQVVLKDETNSYVWKACRQVSLGWKSMQSATPQEHKESEEDEPILSSLPNLTEGQTLALQQADVIEQKSKPKPLYTEATLLSAMEHAGKEVEDVASKKALAECGIGTPATRANIIETLILRDYIRREKRSIVPTEKGLAVYEIVKDKRIANAEMTGAWEVALAAIEAGSMDAGKFAQGINSYVSTICEELLSLAPAPRPQSYPTYHCPKCGRESVGIYAKVARCKNDDCDFHIFREVCGTYLSEENIRDLITKGHTPILKGLTSKAGKKFNARLVLQEDNSTKFEFEQKRKK